MTTIDEAIKQVKKLSAPRVDCSSCLANQYEKKLVSRRGVLVILEEVKAGAEAGGLDSNARLDCPTVSNGERASGTKELPRTRLTTSRKSGDVEGKG